MTRKLDATQEGASPVLSLRLSPDLARALAAEAKRRSTAAGGVPVSPASVARVLLERALLPGPVTSTPTPTEAQLEERVEAWLQAVISRFKAQGKTVPPAVAEMARRAMRGQLLENAQPPRQSSTPRSTPPRSKAAAAPPAPAPTVASSSSTPPADAPQEAAQSPRRSSTPRSTARRAKAAAAPPAPVVADDDDEAAAIARHDERGRQHTELARIETLRANLAAARVQTGLSFKKIGAAVGCCDGSVIRFLDGRIQGWPTWGDKARAWLDALPPAAPPAPAPDLQRPLFAAEQGTP